MCTLYIQLLYSHTLISLVSSLQELSPPLVDDFLYLCDDAYTRDELIMMERSILYTLSYDINVPVAYRFLRRLARVRLLMTSINNNLMH